MHVIHRMLKDYLQGVPIHVLQQQYWPCVETLKFHISTVGAVINAAAARERGMGQLSQGQVDWWGCHWAGHSEYSGATALQRGGPRGF